MDFEQYIQGIYGDISTLDQRTLNQLKQVWNTNPQLIINTYNQKHAPDLVQKTLTRVAMQADLNPGKIQTPIIEISNDDLSAIDSFQKAFKIAKQRGLKQFKWKSTKSNHSGLFGTELASNKQSEKSRKQGAERSKTKVQPSKDLKDIQSPTNDIVILGTAPKTESKSQAKVKSDSQSQTVAQAPPEGTIVVQTSKGPVSTQNQFTIPEAIIGAAGVGAAGAYRLNQYYKNKRLVPNQKIVIPTRVEELSRAIDADARSMKIPSDNAVRRIVAQPQAAEVRTYIESGPDSRTFNASKLFGKLGILGAGIDFIRNLFPTPEEESAAEEYWSNRQKYGRDYDDPYFRRSIDQSTKEYQQGGQLNMNEQQLQQAFIQFLAQKTGARNQQELEAAIQQLGEEGLKQAYAEFMQMMQQQQVQAAKFGAKLNYIKSLRGQCPEGYEISYYKVGGTLCKKCMKKQQEMKDGGQVPKNPIDEFKCGRKMKKAQGGAVDFEKCGGKTKKTKKKEEGGELNSTKNPKAFSKMALAKCGTKLKEACKGMQMNKCGKKLKKKATGGTVSTNKGTGQKPCK